MTHNEDMILDAHTHLTGSEEPDQILECMNACAVEKAFVFSPELDVKTRRLTNDDLEASPPGQPQAHRARSPLPTGRTARRGHEGHER
jgi:hypothetical protein